MMGGPDMYAYMTKEEADEIYDINYESYQKFVEVYAKYEPEYEHWDTESMQANPEGLEDYVRRQNEAYDKAWEESKPEREVYYRLAEKKLEGYALKREGTSRYIVKFIEDRPPVILKKE